MKALRFGTAAAAVVSLALLAVLAAWGQEPVLWSTTAVAPSGVDVVEVQQPPCFFTNWGLNALVDAGTGLWWDDPRGPLVYVLRDTLDAQGVAWADVYTQTGAPPYNYAGAFPLTVPNVVGNSITVHIPSGIVVVAQGATVGYYTPGAYNLMMTHSCPGQIASFDHITGDCAGNLAALATDVAGNPVFTCLPNPAIFGSCACPAPVTIPVTPPGATTWRHGYITSDMLGGFWMAGSYVPAGGTLGLDGEVWYINAGLGVFTRYVPAPGQSGGGRFIYPAYGSNCDEVDVFVAEQSTMPAPTTARIYRLRFTVATRVITLVASFRYGQPPMYDALGTINVETGGANPGRAWLSVADLTNARVLFDQFTAMLIQTPCGVPTGAANFAPWVRGSGSKYSLLVCPRCP